MTTLTILVLAQLLATPTHGTPVMPAVRSAHPASATVVPNDNRTSAGTLINGVLTLKLEATTGTWSPEGPHGPSLQFPVFAEQGKAPQIPGPLIRVPAGTEVRVSIHNGFARKLCIRGLQDRSSAVIDTADIEPGATREIRFRATTPGTFYYWGRTSTRYTDGPAMTDDAELVGGLVVDPPGSARLPADRIMMITTFWDTLEIPGRKPETRELLAVNGLSWPYTERLQYTAGDTVRWRVLNAGLAPHPMHLHGFYFTVNSRGDLTRDTIYTEAQRRKAVTEYMAPGATMTMTWVPTRPGNWLFHCHLIYHIDADLRLADHAPTEMEGHATGHAEQMMAGLVMGIRVAPARGSTPAVDPVARRSLRVFVDQKANVYRDKPGYSFVLQEGATPPARDSVAFPSSTIVLHRNEPTEITVVNRTSVESSIHWHGIELESFYDGVGGWSGAGTRVAPVIAPGDSFVVRMTPDRSGTFIYHTHSDESVQLNSGLYGALLVLDEGRQRDANERIFLMGEGGPQDDAVPFVNGSATPPLVELHAGGTSRFRLINISAAAAKRVRLVADTAVQQWRAFAKDGADLPPRQATMRAAVALLGPGETMDFEVTRAKPEILTLEVITPRGQRPPLVQKIPVIVR
jgi:FtsP/CotA-like multicopper oxidase with cupredoxin domain